MTNKLEIDRELAESLLKCLEDAAVCGYPSPCEAQELRALLAADELRDHCKQCADVVKEWPESKRDCLGTPPIVQTLHANGDRIAMEATIAQQAQRIADLEAGPVVDENAHLPHKVESLSDFLSRGAAKACGQCKASTADICNQNGCGFLESGNGAPVVEDHEAEALKRAWQAGYDTGFYAKNPAHERTASPVVERQEPVALITVTEIDREYPSPGRNVYVTWLNDSDKTLSTGDKLYAEQPAPVSHQEPVAYMRNEGVPNNLVKCTFTCPGAFGVYRKPAPVAVVLPERILGQFHDDPIAEGQAYGWNSYDDEFKRLNPGLIDKVKGLKQ